MARKITKKKSVKKAPRTKKAATLNSPMRRSCACMQVHFGLLDKYPEFRANHSRIEHHCNHCAEVGDSAFRRGTVTIPAVVHVVYKKTSENISDRQINSQIAALNKDFGAKNPDIKRVPKPFKPYVGNPKLQFALAKKDPQGRKTKGITRTKTAMNSFAGNDGVKSRATGGVAPWDAKNYLNIWVCTLSGNLLGYAQFPGGPPETDGVVILNTAFGTAGTASAPFNRGRTTTHEIGHYLNLFHIWGNNWPNTCNDGDSANDTPNQFGPNGGKPVFPSVSCGNAPNGDMFMNYMDYVDDAAMLMFTRDQVNRMKATLSGPRSELGA